VISITGIYRNVGENGKYQAIQRFCYELDRQAVEENQKVF
jgi:hypothetical protein